MKNFQHVTTTLTQQTLAHMSKAKNANINLHPSLPFLPKACPFGIDNGFTHLL